MILRELDLDIPFLDKDKRYEFCNDVRCISAHYFSYLPKRFVTKNFWKLLIECNNSEENSETYLGVKIVKVNFNYKHYITLDNYYKKVVILETLHKGIIKASKEEGWQQSIFEECRTKIVNDNLNFSWVFKKPKKNRKRNLVATAICSHDIDAFVVNVSVTDRSKKLIYEQNILKEQPNEFVFAYLLGDFKWVSNEELEFYDKSKQPIAKIKIIPM